MKSFLQKIQITATTLTSSKKMMLLLFVCSLSSIFNQIIYAQTATASVKEKTFLIGDWIPVDLFVSSTANNKVAFPSLKDSITETIEVANYTPIDTIKKSGQYEYHQLVNLIVFDTGNINLPQFQFLVDNNGKIDTILTSPITVRVAGVKIDTTKDIKDIKAPLKIPYTFKEILPYIIALLILLIIIGIIVWYIKKRKQKQQPIDEKFLLPPHVWALKELEKLHHKKLWQTGAVKNYYSELTDIARTYIELRYKIPAMEKTTDELMDSMHKGMMKQSLKKELNDVLILSDFVKFAKAQPDFVENENAFKVVQDFIDKTKQIEEIKKGNDKNINIINKENTK
ncbi:MAG: hypothetical protein U0T07_00440 [Chitinophagales bacterium]|nr:hypothetical protein [Chitinophagales bacterium]